MNEFEATRQYVKTLHKVYKEKGLSRAILHELTASVNSIGARVIAAIEFFSVPYKSGGVLTCLMPYDSQDKNINPFQEVSEIIQSVYSQINDPELTTKDFRKSNIL